MPVKAPMYLKTSQLQKGKKHLRLRDVLTPDMISPPLGDFRHTAHLGSAVSTEELSLFMDISFLGTPCNETPLSPLSPTTFAAWDGSPIQSPALKNAISLPGTDAPRALILPRLSPHISCETHQSETAVPSLRRSASEMRISNQEDRDGDEEKQEVEDVVLLRGRRKGRTRPASTLSMGDEAKAGPAKNGLLRKMQVMAEKTFNFNLGFRRDLSQYAEPHNRRQSDSDVTSGPFQNRKQNVDKKPTGIPVPLKKSLFPSRQTKNHTRTHPLPNKTTYNQAEGTGSTFLLPFLCKSRFSLAKEVEISIFSPSSENLDGKDGQKLKRFSFSPSSSQSLFLASEVHDGKSQAAFTRSSSVRGAFGIKASSNCSLSGGSSESEELERKLGNDSCLRTAPIISPCRESDDYDPQCDGSVQNNLPLPSSNDENAPSPSASPCRDLYHENVTNPLAPPVNPICDIEGPILQDLKGEDLQQCTLGKSTSIQSFSLDLGPSLFDEVMRAVAKSDVGELDSVACS